MNEYGRARQQQLPIHTLVRLRFTSSRLPKKKLPAADKVYEHSRWQTRWLPIPSPTPMLSEWQSKGSNKVGKKGILLALRSLLFQKMSLQKTLFKKVQIKGLDYSGWKIRRKKGKKATHSYLYNWYVLHKEPVNVKKSIKLSSCNGPCKTWGSNMRKNLSNWNTEPSR